MLTQLCFHGARYAYADASLGVGQASPAAKVATLSRESLALAHAVRCQLDAAAAAAVTGEAAKLGVARPGAGAESGGAAAGGAMGGAPEPDLTEAVDVEIVARGAHDCWVAGRAAGPRRLLLAMENRGEDSLLEAAGLAAGFVDTHFSGLLE